MEFEPKCERCGELPSNHPYLHLFMEPDDNVMTFDPTTNRILHGLLTEEERKAIETAKHGWQVWGSITKKWDDVEQPRWQDGVVYRAKPAPVVTSVWRNVYPPNTWTDHNSRERAKNFQMNGCIAVLRIDVINGETTVHIESV